MINVKFVYRESDFYEELWSKKGRVRCSNLVRKAILNQIRSSKFSYLVDRIRRNNSKLDPQELPWFKFCLQLRILRFSCHRDRRYGRPLPRGTFPIAERTGSWRAPWRASSCCTAWWSVASGGCRLYSASGGSWSGTYRCRPPPRKLSYICLPSHCGLTVPPLLSWCLPRTLPCPTCSCRSSRVSAGQNPVRIR